VENKEIEKTEWQVKGKKLSP